MYDFIGDVHGYESSLISLLETLGYRRISGVYRHPEADRRAVFLGDLIDRGPRIRETVNLVRAMVQAGTALAIMGNHEYNAICFQTAKPSEPHRWMRSRTDKNLHQHLETLYQFRDHRQEWEDHIRWFGTLPLWLDLGGVRAVHAAWHRESMDTIMPLTGEGNRLTIPELLRLGTIRGNAEFDALQNILKGPEIPLPSGSTFFDKDGYERTEMRIRWWLAAEGRSFGELAFKPLEKIRDLRPDPDVARRFSGYHDTTPVFFGHYWFKDAKPEILEPRLACLDYSVASNGILAAYTWDGERELDNSRFTFV